MTEDGGLSFTIEANATTTPKIFGREALPLYCEGLPGTGKMLIEATPMPVDSKGVVAYSVVLKPDPRDRGRMEDGVNHA